MDNYLIKPKYIGKGYLLRWHLIPRNRFFNIYLHKFIGDDDDRALHDHPWNSFSVRLKGGLYEYKNMPVKFHDETVVSTMTIRDKAKRFSFRKASDAHRIALIDKNKPAWTIFITGPRIREWGFLCKKGWQHWSTMTTEDGKTIGGCE